MMRQGLRWVSLIVCGAAVVATTVRGTCDASGATLRQPQEAHQIVVRLPISRQSVEKLEAVTDGQGVAIAAQAVPPGLGDDPKPPAYMVCVLPRWPASQPLQLLKTRLQRPPTGRFRFVDKPGETLDVVWEEGDKRRPVLQYVYRRHNPTDHYFTFKPFHHVYDPIRGEKFLTSGTVKTAKEGLFPHHRGLFFGFNRISYGKDQTADIWHGTQGAFSQHEEFVEQVAGPVLARHRARIGWYGRDGRLFAQEEREVTVYAAEGGTLLDWSSRLTTTLPQVRLDGDPQHAGFHFRAAQEVANNGKAHTYYVRPDGKGKPGETRNWDVKKPDRRTVNLPWNAMSFVLDGHRYSVLRIVHPTNPGETRGSERDYGRFGDYFEYDLTPERPLLLRYRLWIQAGEVTPEQCAAIARGFRQPPPISWREDR